MKKTIMWMGLCAALFPVPVLAQGYDGLIAAPPSPGSAGTRNTGGYDGLAGWSAPPASQNSVIAPVSPIGIPAGAPAVVPGEQTSQDLSSYVEDTGLSAVERRKKAQEDMMAARKLARERAEEMRRQQEALRKEELIQVNPQMQPMTQIMEMPPVSQQQQAPAEEAPAQ